MLLAIIFSVSAILGIVFLVQSQLSVIWRAVYSVILIVFTMLAYLFATRSGISPYGSSTGVGFGFWDQSMSVAVGVTGAILGVVGSQLIAIGKEPFAWHTLLKPLLIAPVVIIPTIKLIETAGEQSLISMLLLFAVSYQNGFFWERIMKEGKPV